jgi:putative transposase
MVTQVKPGMSISDIVQRFKGGSSRKVREEFPELEEFLWGDSFWSDGYFAELVGKFDIAIIKKYIQNQ